MTGNRNEKIGLFRGIASVIAAALVKFAALYCLIVKIVLPLLSLNEKQTAVISASFSWPQLVTALIGSSLAVLVFPRLKKAIKTHN